MTREIYVKEAIVTSRAYVVHVYLSWKVVKAKHKSPVEVSFSGQRVKVDIRLLFVSFQTLYPSVCNDQSWKTECTCPKIKQVIIKQTNFQKFYFIPSAELFISQR